MYLFICIASDSSLLCIFRHFTAIVKMQEVKDTKPSDDADNGIPIITSSKSTKEKIFWILLILTALGFVLYFSSVLVKQHNASRVLVARNIDLSNEMVFPAITFCNTNYYDDWQNETQSLKPLPPNCKQSFNASNFGSRKEQMYFNKACDTFLARGNNNYSALNFVSFAFPTYFTTQRNTGPCYTLNRNKELKQKTIAGIKTGLHMMLYMNESEIERDPKFADGNPLLYDQRNGLMLSIHDQDVYFAGLFEEGIPIPAGYHTMIALKKSDIQRKTSPFPSDCVHDGKERYLKKFPGKHNVKICIVTCFFS